MLLLSVVFWSGSWVLGRGLRAEMPPVALGFWRWLICLICLLPWAWRPLLAQRKVLARHWRLLWALGVFGGACNGTIGYVGVTMTTATNAVLLGAASPVITVALSWALLNKRLLALEWLGVFISLAGVLIIVSHGDPQTLLELRPNRGDLWVLWSFVSWGLYTVLLTRQPVQLDPIPFLAAISFTGLTVLAPFYAWEIAGGQVFELNVTTISALAYAGVFVSLLGYVFWNRAVAVVGSNAAGAFMNLMPAAGTLLAIAFLGEQPQLFQLVGILLILAGLTLTARRRRVG